MLVRLDHIWLASSDYVDYHYALVLNLGIAYLYKDQSPLIPHEGRNDFIFGRLVANLGPRHFPYYANRALILPKSWSCTFRGNMPMSISSRMSNLTRN